MFIPRNGASAICFEKVIFLFGGMNEDLGVLDEIEKYSILKGRWCQVKIKLIAPIHDCLTFNLGGARVLIFGGQTKNHCCNDRFDIYDLTLECMSPVEYQLGHGRYALPTVFEN